MQRINSALSQCINLALVGKDFGWLIAALLLSAQVRFHGHDGGKIQHKLNRWRTTLFPLIKRSSFWMRSKECLDFLTIRFVRYRVWG